MSEPVATSATQQLRRSFVEEEIEIKEQEPRSQQGTSLQQQGTGATTAPYLQYTDGQTFVHKGWNAFVSASRWWTSSNQNQVEEVQAKMDLDKYSKAQALANVLKPIEVGCNVGQTAVLLAPYFGEDKPFAQYLPEGTSLMDFALAVENPDLAHNATLLGIYREFLGMFSDNVRDALSPLMKSESISLERKVLELLRLAHLEDYEECQSTTVDAFLACFDQLPEMQQVILLEEHFKSAENKMTALRSSETIDYIRDDILGGYLAGTKVVDRDFALVESMQVYAGLHQETSVKALFERLSAGSKAKLATHEIAAQKRKETDRRPLPGRNGYTYFDKAPTGVVANKALAAFLADGKEALAKFLAE